MSSQERLFDELNTKSNKAANTASPPSPSGNDAASDPTIIAQIHTIVQAIPQGRVMSYGAVGAHCSPPISGYICGRIMNHAIKDVPWWRVVAKDGSLPINKRNPHLAMDQRKRLEAEGVEFGADGRILQSYFES